MAMNLSSGGGDPEVMMDINTTPLIDVMLVLLVMLIITIPIQLHTVNLNMPAGNPPPPTREPVVVTIDIDFKAEDEAVYLTLDGQVGVAIAQGDTVVIQTSEQRTRLILFPESNYYDVLREKLKWGDG